MNRPLWLARLLGVGGVLESIVGLGLLVAPSGLAALILRSPLEGSGLVLARLAGGGLLSLGIACWLARKTPVTPASLGVAWSLLTYSVIACVTLAFAAFSPATGGPMTLGLSVMHGVFSVLLAAALGARAVGARVIMFLVLSTLTTGTARAGDEWEFWPELNAFVELTHSRGCISPGRTPAARTPSTGPWTWPATSTSRSNRS